MMLFRYVDFVFLIDFSTLIITHCNRFLLINSGLIIIHMAGLILFITALTVIFTLGVKIYHQN